MPAPALSDPPSLRPAVARLLARHFLVHLRTEVQKPDEVLHEVFTDWPVRRILHDLIEGVQAEFGLTPDDPLPDINIIEIWTDRSGNFAYADSAFVTYNAFFFQRLLDLRDGTAESRTRMFATMAEGFRSFDYEGRGFTSSLFLDTESVMREVLRETVRQHLPEVAAEAEALIVAQSRIFQTGLIEYFEGLLKTTLAENVRLLHNILPDPVVTELQQKGFVDPVHFEDAAVLFTDFESFSILTEHLAPAEVLRRLDLYFTEFDRIAAAHGLEKIKTIGDSYMAVAGVPRPHPDAVAAVCDAALEMRAASDRISAGFGREGWRIRIGLHVGPLMAGVIGKQKFSYDVWGATVNFASRMESSGEPGQINVSADLHARVRERYRWQPRGHQPVKRLGTAEMFFLLGRKTGDFAEVGA
ncbi:MAG: adenylate/guanylate cyclase domain-containing protein [Verrucomicrobia bacterium]|nr:adenylate/guanylate cyclase domain-containing protein [Verrucomicrobiota bacterium]